MRSKKQLEILIPIPEKVSLNQIYAGMHWRQRSELAELYHMSLLEYRNQSVKKYPVSITYIFTFRRNALDSSNCAFMAKMIEDALVQMGVLVDDTPKYVESTTLYSVKGTEDTVKIIIN